MVAIENERGSLAQIFRRNTSFSGESHTELFIGPMASGMKYDDERLYEGLNVFLRQGGYDRLDRVVMTGGLIPEIPHFYSRGNAHQMRLLGVDETKKGEWMPSKTDDFLAEFFGGTEEERRERFQKFKEKHVDGKIDTREEAVSYSQRQMQKMFEGLDVGKVDYCYGQADRKNRINDEELLVNQIRKKTNEHLRNIRDEKKATDRDLQRFESELRRQKEIDRKPLSRESREMVKIEIDNLEKSVSQMKDRSSSLQRDISSAEREIEQGSSATQLTKRVSMTAHDSEMLYQMTKDKYHDDLKSCFPKELKRKVALHGTRTTMLDNRGNMKHDEDNDLIDGKLFVMNSTNFRGDAPMSNELEKAKSEVVRRAGLERELGKKLVPETVLVAHGANGFGATAVNVTPESRAIDGSYRADPRITDIITLPAFQSTEQLLKYRDKGLKNWDIARFDKGPFASGAVIYHKLEDGSTQYEHIESSFLTRLADMKREAESKPKGSADRKKLESEIKEMCRKDLKVRAFVGDVHIGSPNFKGTPSNEERFNRVINYMSSVYGHLPDELILTEMIDGQLTHHEGFGERTYATPFATTSEKLLSKISKMKNPSKKDLLGLLDEATKEFRDYSAQNPITNRGKQYDHLEPFIGRMVRAMDLDQITIISGNHGRGEGGADEAQQVDYIIQKYNCDGKIEVLRADNMGGKEGGQGTVASERVMLGGREIDTGRRIDYYHQPGGFGIHAINKHLQKKGNQPDERFAGHIHHPYIGFANGTALTINPACQGPGNYVESLGVPSTLYGFVVKYSDVNPKRRGWHGWHMILDNTLERPEYKPDILEKGLEDLKKRTK